MLTGGLSKEGMGPSGWLDKDNAKVFKFIAVLSIFGASAFHILGALPGFRILGAGSKLIELIRSMCFEMVVYQESSWFDEPSYSRYIGVRLSTDASNLKVLCLDANIKVMYEEASQVANDAVTNIRTVTSFNAKQKVMDLYQGKCESPMKHGVRLGIINGLGLFLRILFSIQLLLPFSILELVL
ncbi:hypothetical protein IFM89_003080 [Coptis chinensis]|uniref:ABC transmembrane type-1 domain-containing protein n=1 Tax=Coptis chinensis TaxID=261450 RepID=A0A835LY65_9MAGN|nr:hypothetical protein IFM89_003080 [Coptis chinensis]